MTPLTPSLGSFARLLVGLLLAFVVTHVQAQPARATPGAADLRIDSRVAPLGIDSPQPRFSWLVRASDPATRGVAQTAYRIVVASTAEKLAAGEGDLWDSGRVASDATQQVVYAGRPLVSSQRCWWRVKLWDQSGRESAWSEPASWTMGLLAPGDWTARWIAAPAELKAASLLLRREFAIKPRLTRAVVHVTGLGHYELFLNGQKVGVDLLSPGWTDYRKTILYDTFDVTALLKPGANAAGLALGNGFYNIPGGRYTKLTGTFGPQKAIAQWKFEYADGSVETLGTDATWQVKDGPVTFTCVFGGEDFDARKEPAGWKQPGLPPAGWQVAAVTDGPGGELKGASFAAPPIRAFEVFKPAATKELKPGVAVYDLGQNTSLMPRIIVRGPAGSSVKITPSELVREDGDIDDTMCQGKSYWLYTLKGEGAEPWFPQFFYRGARYLKVDFTPAPGATGDAAQLPVLESIEGVVVHSAAEPAGTFASSNALFNRIHPLVRWAQRSNLVSIITDCPHREKLGWLEQYHLNGPALRYEWNLETLFVKTARDMHDSQIATGLVPSISPEYTKFGGDGDRNPFRNSPEWGSAIILSAWQQYEFHGDTALLRQNYEAMQRYATYLTGKAKDHILDFGLGDWYDIGPKPPGPSQLTPKALTATAIFYEGIRALGRTARLLGKPEDAARYEAQALEIRAAFNEKFYDAATKNYATGSQTANAMPLVLDFVEPADRAAVVANIVANVESTGLTAGDVGYRYLIRALADNGRSDVIFTMNNQSDKPGYGMQLAKGATALSEAWDALRQSSQNHFMLGQINEWFYHDLAGIRTDPDGLGFKKIVIKPAIVGDFTHVNVSYASTHGRIRSEWKRDGAKLTLAVTVPANTTATVHVPTRDAARIVEGTTPAGRSPGVNYLRTEGGAALFVVGSGSYVFTSDLP